MSHITLQPAYGHDYKSRAEVIRDLAAGKDFLIASVHRYQGSYCTAQDLIAGGEFNVNVRFKANRSVCVVDLRKLDAEVAKANKPKAPSKPRKPVDGAEFAASQMPNRRVKFDSLEDELEAIMPELKG